MKDEEKKKVIDEELVSMETDIKASQEIKAMMEHLGWKYMQAYLEKKLKHFNNISTIKQSAKETEFQMVRSVIRHTAKHEVYADFVGFMMRIINSGELAKSKLDHKMALDAEKKKNNE